MSVVPAMPVGLANQILRRQKFIERVIDFAKRAITQRGRVLSREVFSCHIKTESELNNLRGFSFWRCGLHTMYGGNTLKVWYHPNKNERSGEPVLEIEWQDIEECQVKQFDPSLEWQTALKRMMKQEKRVLARAGELERCEIIRQEKCAAADTLLRKNAERLKLI